MQLNEPGRQKLGSLGGYQSWQQAQHKKLYSDRLQTEEGTLDSPGLLPGGVSEGGGTLISASAVPHRKAKKHPTKKPAKEKEGANVTFQYHVTVQNSLVTNTQTQATVQNSLVTNT